MSTHQSTKHYLWCDRCRRSFSYADAPDQVCPICSEQMREMSKIGAILRGIMATELSVSDVRRKHRQLIKMIWTRNGMGERYYRVLVPDMPYAKFETKVTDLVCRGAYEGWVKIVIPAAPSDDDADYRIEFESEERFVQELADLAERESKPKKAN
jgi:hypothetical protein